MRWVTPTRITAEEAAVTQVRALGYDPGEVKTIILSHFDPDHFGGLKDFPNARVACSWRAWEDVRSLSRWGALKARLLPGHLPEDMAGRLWLLPDPAGPPISVFDASLDLFGDGSVRLVSLPGHAPGQLGAFVRRSSDGADLLLAADAVWIFSGAGRGVHTDGWRWTRAQDETYQLGRRRRMAGASGSSSPIARAWRDTGERGNLGNELADEDIRCRALAERIVTSAEVERPCGIAGLDRSATPA
jgi:glyoxylase-like metal-dependent hydrolase (beta-lactamase superfamily II)